MSEIKLGRIYKRKKDNYPLGSYPDYLVLTSICDYMRKRKRYKFLDVLTGKQSTAFIPEIVVEEYYELVDNGDTADGADTAGR